MREDLRYIETLIEDKEYSSHPSDKELADFIDKKLEGESRDEVVEHLTHCYKCRDVVNEVIEYKKKPKFVNNIIVAMPLIALVASLIVLVYLPQDIGIGMIDLSKTSLTSFKFKAGGSQKQDRIIDGDKFLKKITKSTDLTYLESFNQAEEEKNFDKAIGLYQEAINSISEKISEQERLKQIIIIHSRILQRAIEVDKKVAISNYKEKIRDNIRTYYLKEKK